MTFIQQSGILHRFFCPYNLAQNGRVDRKHRHVVETGLALLAHYAILAICFPDNYVSCQ